MPGAPTSVTLFFTDFNKAAIETANVVIRSLLLVNGGAAVALLAFVGAVESGCASVKSELLADPILRFVMGVAMSVVTAFLAYIANFADAWATGSRKTVSHYPNIQETAASERISEVSSVFHILALLAAIVWLWAFLDGVWMAAAPGPKLGIF